MNFLRTTPLFTVLPFVALFFVAAALPGCERQGDSTNNADNGEQQKPENPTTPTE